MTDNDSPQHLDFPAGPMIRQLVAAALREDLGRADVTAAEFVNPEKMARGVYLSREEFVLCGGPILPLVFEIVDPKVTVKAHFPDGKKIEPDTAIAQAEGAAVSLLAAERVSLNFLQRLCGIASTARSFVEAVRGTRAIILDTRKTTPGLRALEKYAVRSGGASNHRFGLDDGFLVKENHIVAAGGLDRILERMESLDRSLLKVEIEVQTLDQLRTLTDRKVDVVMLDNMTPAQVAEAVRLVNGRFKLEASGGITLQNVRAYAETGVNFISVGALTHSYKSSNISFLLQN
ncbi:MAG TPA: carboxylating nicotinate-nucleotide diphosphorylase [Acidobacteriota bacterium]|jgi:nicotinate-nucleotide pyrophosphorylase (carboxylating)